MTEPERLAAKPQEREISFVASEAQAEEHSNLVDERFDPASDLSGIWITDDPGDRG